MRRRILAGWIVMGAVLAGCVPPPEPPAPSVASSAPAVTPPPPVPMVGPKAVWHPDPLPCQTLNGPAEACLRTAMAAAPPEAQAFAASQGWKGMLTYLGNEGKVVSGTLTTFPLSPTSDVPVLLNGTPSLISVPELWEKHMVPTLAKKYPKGDSTYVAPFLVKAEKIANGGQRFIYEGEVRECKECMAKARPRLRLVFDKTGRLLGPER